MPNFVSTLVAIILYGQVIFLLIIMPRDIVCRATEELLGMRLDKAVILPVLSLAGIASVYSIHYRGDNIYIMLSLAIPIVVMITLCVSCFTFDSHRKDDHEDDV